MPRLTASTAMRQAVRSSAVILFLAGFLASQGCSSKSDSQPGINPEAAAIVSASRDRFATQAKVEATETAMAAAIREAEKQDFGPLQSLQGLGADDKKAFAEALSHRLQNATRDIKANTDRLRAALDALDSEWRLCTDVRLAQAAVADRAERDSRKAQQTALALGAENRWFWLSGLVAVSALLAVIAIDRRHDIRRYLSGGRARDLGLAKILVIFFTALCLLTAALFFASDGLLVDLLDRGGSTAMAAVDRQRADDAAATARAAAELRERDDRLAARKAEVRTRFNRLVRVEAAGSLFDDWWENLEAERERRTMAFMLAASAERFNDDRQSVDPTHAGSVAAAIEENKTSAGAWRRRARVITGFMGLGIISLVVAGFGWFLRNAAQRSRALADTCPLCLAAGTLKPDDQRSGVVRCHNVISESPFEECGFDFPDMYRTLTKLSFPTLGVPTSGKTHWLAMVYRQLNQGSDIPQSIEFAKIQSRASEEFDETCDNILNSKKDPIGTQTAKIPHPLVFNFVDRDRLGRSNLLVNIFDYSGEVLRSMTLEQHQRRRAFTADGYFFFLDPTQTSDVQIGPLTQFRQDVRIVKNLRAGQQLQCPVALCVPKIDLLSGEPYADPAGGDAVDHFYRQIGEIGWGMDLHSMVARSTLMRNLRETIWPGWEIEQTIDQIFGGRYMFFPFTPVGLDGMGQDWTAGTRPIAPVGTLHPLMWLLQMNGYAVLPSTITS